MEMLFIIIFIMIISSILRSLQSAARPTAPPIAPPPLQEGPDHEEIEIILKELSGQEEKKASSRIGIEEKKKPSPPPVERAAPKPHPDREIKDGNKLNEGLSDLFGSEKIALGVVASEVLSAPRARRPFNCRRVP